MSEKAEYLRIANIIVTCTDLSVAALDMGVDPVALGCCAVSMAEGCEPESVKDSIDAMFGDDTATTVIEVAALVAVAARYNRSASPEALRDFLSEMVAKVRLYRARATAH